MIDYALRKRIKRCLDGAIELLGIEYRRSTIERPLDQAAASFDIAPFIEKAPTEAGMLRMAAAFVQNIVRYGTRIRRELTKEQAEREALRLLRTYSAPPEHAVQTAFVEYAESSETGPIHICTFLLNTLKHMEIQAHRRWVYEAAIESLSWPERVMAVRCLAELHGTDAMQEVFKYPERYAPYLREMLENYVECQDDIQHMLRGH